MRTAFLSIHRTWYTFILSDSTHHFCRNACTKSMVIILWFNPPFV